jgi:hypothetical protein
MLGIVADEDVRWAGPQLTPHPLKTYEEAVRRPSGDWERIPRTYVFCEERSFGGVFEPFAEAASVEPGWDRVDIAGGHEPFITSPEVLSRTLLQLG